jgi:hypothetical protein
LDAGQDVGFGFYPLHVPVLAQKLTKWPSRRRLIWAGVVIALIGCAWATVQRGPFDGLALLAGLCGVLSLALLLVPAKPRLEVQARTEDGTAAEVVIGTSHTLRPLDKDAIVGEQVAAAFATLPAPPQPEYRPGTPLSRVLAQTAATGFLTNVFASEESREEFSAEVEDYRRDLRSWLDELERSRSERKRSFGGVARVVECGEAPADHVRLRLRFPPGFEPPEDPPWVSEPPKRPHFAPPLAPLINPLIDVPPIERPNLPSPASAASYWREGEATVVEYDLGRINQADFRDTPELRLRAASPGTYVVEWEVSAAGLRRPARGRWELEVAESKQGEAISTLSEAVRERERYDLD